MRSETKGDVEMKWDEHFFNKSCEHMDEMEQYSVSEDPKDQSFLCPKCKIEMIDLQYLDYFGGVCQKCGYDFYTGWTV